MGFCERTAGRRDCPPALEVLPAAHRAWSQLGLGCLTCSTPALGLPHREVRDSCRKYNDHTNLQPHLQADKLDPAVPLDSLCPLQSCSWGCHLHHLVVCSCHPRSECSFKPQGHFKPTL